MILNSFFNTAENKHSTVCYICVLKSKNFIRCYRNTGNHFLYAFPLVSVPQDSYPNSHNGITSRMLMGTGRLEKAKSASQNESE